MTQERIDKFNCADPLGSTNLTIAEYTLKYMSMYKVLMIQTGEVWHYRCQCKAYMSTAALCSHAIACMHKDDKVDLNVMCKVVEGPKQRGRKRAKTRNEGPLVVELYTGNNPSSTVCYSKQCCISMHYIHAFTHTSDGKKKQKTTKTSKVEKEKKPTKAQSKKLRERNQAELRQQEEALK